MTTLIIYVLFIPVLVVILLFANLALAIHKPDSEKVSAYECGFQPIYGQNRNPFTIAYYVVALLFLIFDIEILCIFPIAASLYSLEAYGFYVGIIFFIILTVGFVFEFASGALYFTNQRSNPTKYLIISPQ